MRYSDFTMHQINCMSFTLGTQAKIKRVQKKSNIYKSMAKMVLKPTLAKEANIFSELSREECQEGK